MIDKLKDMSLNSTDNKKEGASSNSERSIFLRPLFLVIVALPTLIAVLYFGVFASPIYISESNFVVRTPDRAAASPLGAIFGSTGLSSSSEETKAVMEYVRSRDALEATNVDGLVSKAYSTINISWFDRFGGFGELLDSNSKEHLYAYFQKKVEITLQPTTQVGKLIVRAYSPEDALKINQRLLSQSESLVNQLSQRAQRDEIAVAEKEVEEAKNLSRDAAVALARLRTKEGIINPEQEAAIRLQMISKLQDELISTRTQLQQLRLFTPKASQIRFLRARLKSLQGEIKEQTSLIAGGGRSLSRSAVQFQELRLASETADKLLTAKLASLEQAQADSRRKRAYVQRVSQPSLPDYALEPRRIRGIIATLFLSLLAWGILSTLLAGVREHRE